LDLAAAARARLAALAVHAQVRAPFLVELEQALAHLGLEDGSGPLERRAHRMIEASYVGLIHRAAAAVRMELRLPQDLIRVRIADAGHELLVRQRALDLAGVPPDARDERLFVDLE